MSRIEIIKRSHSFQVKTNYRGLAQIIAKFGERFEEREWKKVKGQPATFQLIRSYHVTNDTQNHFTFHINAYKEFIGYLNWVGINESLYTVEQMPMHKPEKIDIKIVSPYKPMEEQVPLIKYLGEPGKTKILTLQTGKGKSVGIEEPVLTSKGWVPCGELSIDDELVTPDGRRGKVDGIYPQGKRKLYNVTFSDGRNVPVDLEHFWKVHVEGEWSIKSTEQIIEHLKVSEDYISVPVMEPYDGHTSHVDLEIEAYEIGLQAVGTGLSIPDDYLNHTYLNRMDLAKAILGEDPKQGTFTTAGSHLAKDVQYLVRSLGGKATLTEGDDFTVTYDLEDKFLDIVLIEYSHEEEAICISIDHPAQLFIVRDFIVTHNTYCFLQGFAGIKERCCLILPAKYIQRWVDDLTGSGQVVNLTEEDLWVVKGSADFARLIQKAKDGEFKAKMVIFSSTTFQLYLKAFRDNPVAAMREYGCEPIKLMKLLKVGVLGRDEVHELFHFNFLVDLSVNVPKTISLSATVDFDNKMTNKMCALMFPKAEQINNGEWDKYIKAVGLFWKLEKPKNIRCTLNGAYNHGAFETSIIKHKPTLERYLDMVQDMVESVYSRFDPGEKMIVFAYTVQMCTLISKRLEEAYSHDKSIVINRYVGEDEYCDLLTGDIIVSTLKSAGTAVDIPKLRSVLMTTAIYSTQSNVQALGRLRKLRDKPEVSPEFYYLICKDIDKHIEYHKAKVKQFDGKVLSHETKITQYLV